jgi:DNA-binding MarR family transcriptional regulator
MPVSEPQPKTDPARVASELRVVLGQLLRRLRAQNGFSLSQAAVLGRLDREGSRSVSGLAVSEGVRPQSMAQTVGDLEADGLVERRPDPGDRRRALVSLTANGRAALLVDRGRREGWLAGTMSEHFSAEEQAVLADAVDLLRRLAES